MDILEIDSVHFSYHRIPVLTGVACSVRTGEILGVLGRNGSGKTTLFKILMGLLKTESGFLRFNRNLIGPRHSVFGYLPQHCFLFKPEKVESILKMFFPKNRATRELIESEERIGKIMKFKYGRLSSGEKRYLEALLVLHLDRPFTILDEPFKEIEPKERSRLIALIREKSRSSGILLTDHAYHETMTVCTRLLVLQNGRLINVENAKTDLVHYGYLANEHKID
jgi:lipopolysaccharide export system ATP-binding protein